MMLVKHIVTFENISYEIEREYDSDEPDDKRVQQLMAMRAAESKAASGLSVRLRLAASSQMSPERSFRESIRGRHAAEKKPWESQPRKRKTETKADSAA